MKKTTILYGILAGLIVFSGFQVLPNAAAFEGASQYIIDDYEHISILIEIDSSGTTDFKDVIITPEGSTETYIMDVTGVVSAKITDDLSYGKVIGHTTSGDVMLLLFSVAENGSTQMFAKIWTDDSKIRVSTQGELVSLG